MLGDDDFKLLLEHLDRPWAGFRKVRKGVKKRVRRHMAELGCTTMPEYLGRIDRFPELRAECERRLLVTISRFFRDRRLWDQLQVRLLPELAQRFPAGVKAWSAGCARGEEPYSLAIAWHESMDRHAPRPELSILATDIDPEGIALAREGLFPSSSLKEVPQSIRQRYFHYGRGGRVRIEARLKQCIEWRVLRLQDAPPEQGFQLILLRNNLLTYYRSPVLHSALRGIVGSLAAGGLLVLGSHERLPQGFAQLVGDEESAWIYRLKEG